MNKNKIIFAIIGIILIVSIFFVAISLGKSGEKNKVPQTQKGDLRIWILEDDAAVFSEYVTSLSSQSELLKGKNFLVESFDDYYTYKQAFFSALLSGETPDIFVLPSSENSFLEKQAALLGPTVVSPNDFRKNFKGVFGDDLIRVDGKEVKTEYVVGIPLGYESLGVYYNRRFFNSEDLISWASLSSSLQTVKQKDTSVVPLGIGNGSSVAGVSDIFSGFLVMFGGKDISTIDTKIVEQSLELYQSFARTSGDNAYDTLALSGEAKTNLDYFSEGSVAALIGTPRLLGEIDAKGYKKQFLLAAPFPISVGEEKRLWLKYNYFVVNSASEKQESAQELMKLMLTESAQKAYLEKFPYYLPTLLSLESDMMEQKINPDYNIVYKNFLDMSAIPVSFQTGDTSLYDLAIISVLDAGQSSLALFEKVKQDLICSSSKALTLTNLSSNCK